MAARASSVVALALCATAAPAQRPGPQLYVSNEIANTISVIAPATGSVVGTIAVGKRPRGMALSPDGHTVYVGAQCHPPRPLAHRDGPHRSEEHTSELQSPVHLVCRLLLERQ